MKATAKAHANIALVKYWGKRDPALNLPQAGSLSLTLAALWTRATVQFDNGSDVDTLTIGGTNIGGVPLSRMSQWLDIVRNRAGIALHARVDTESSFPTASGLASSASAYASLALAATRAAGLNLSKQELSVLARRGSGSAARSIYGRFAQMRPGVCHDGSDAYAEPLGDAFGNDIRMVIAIVGGGVTKKHSSRDAMQHCAQTSPLHVGWLSSVPGDLDTANAAVRAADISALGTVAEASALTMHASMWAARPPVMYFEPATLACMDVVRGLRDDGIAAYYTMDAGPHVKVITSATSAADVARAMAAAPGVTDTMVSEPGPGATLE